MSGQPGDRSVGQAASGARASEPSPSAAAHKRRARYKGKHPRKFEEKYKEHRPDLYPETIAKVIDSGKTPAGSHRPIMVAEVIAALAPIPGSTGVDCTLGYGGHAQALLDCVAPGGRVICLDADPLQLPKTEARLRKLGYGPDRFLAIRTNFAGLTSALGRAGVREVDFILADLGVSSMQLDDPARGFSFKTEGPLDMRMNPRKQQSASVLLKRIGAKELANILGENADEPHAHRIAAELAGREFPTTTVLVSALDRILAGAGAEAREELKRRVFQALRIAVNEEFAALENLLRSLPACLKPGGRAAIITFHSGEDRRVKQAFIEGLRQRVYSEISEDVTRPSRDETRSNPRANPAKLRWAIRSGKAMKEAL